MLLKVWAKYTRRHIQVAEIDLWFSLSCVSKWYCIWSLFRQQMIFCSNWFWMKCILIYIRYVKIISVGYVINGPPLHTERIPKAQWQVGKPNDCVRDPSPCPPSPGPSQGTLSPPGWGDSQQQPSTKKLSRAPYNRGGLWETWGVRDFLSDAGKSILGLHEEYYGTVWGGTKGGKRKRSRWFEATCLGCQYPERAECVCVVAYICQRGITSETRWTSWQVGKEAWDPGWSTAGGTRRSKAAAGETMGLGVDWETCVHVCVSVQLKARESKAGCWVDWVSKASYWRDPQCACRGVCVGVWGGLRTSNRRGAAALGACIPMC